MGPTFGQCSRIDYIVISWYGIMANFMLTEPLLTLKKSLDFEVIK